MTRTTSQAPGRPRGRRAAAAVALLVAGGSLTTSISPSSAAETTVDKPIQPGGTIQMYPGPAYPKFAPAGTCTLNFVFRDAGPAPASRRPAPAVYIGTAGHCVSGLTEGARVAAPTTGDFGTIAYLISCRMTPCEGRPIFDDFALIRVDDDKVGLVSPVMRGFGKAPSDYTRSDETSIGDLVVLRTQAAPFSLTEPTSTQTGVLEGDDAVAFGSTLVGPTNSGSPVVRQSDGKALGIIAAYRAPSMLQGTDAEQNEPPLQGGPTVEHIMDLLLEEGLNVRLATSEADIRGAAPRGDGSGSADTPRSAEGSREAPRAAAADATRTTPVATTTSPTPAPRLAGAGVVGLQGGRAPVVLARTGAPLRSLALTAMVLIAAGIVLRHAAGGFRSRFVEHRSRQVAS